MEARERVKKSVEPVRRDTERRAPGSRRESALRGRRDAAEFGRTCSSPPSSSPGRALQETKNEEREKREKHEKREKQKASRKGRAQQGLAMMQ